MLTELRVRNLALVESARVTFGPGLNAVTGATGAGKSLLLQALTLVLGGRWSREVLRTGADRMHVQALFEIRDRDLAARALDLAGAPPPEGDGPFDILVSRQVDASGRNRAEIEGCLVTVGTLRELGQLLGEIHGQSEHQSLLDPVRQTELLDRAAGLGPTREEFANALVAWRAARSRLDALDAEAAARAQRIADLEAIAQEIADVAPEIGEVDALRGERELLAAVERHRSALGAALQMLSEGDDDAGRPALDLIGHATRELLPTAEHSKAVSTAVEALDAAAESVQDAARLVTDALDALEADPERLDRIQERLEELGGLLRRHGPGEADALQLAEEADGEAQRLRADESDAGSLRTSARSLAAVALAAGVALDVARGKAGVKFAESVQTALAELEMPRTRFAVDVPDRGAAPLAAATSLGLGPIELLVAPNAGEDLRPLAKIASGGELARTALAIKGELADADAVPLLAFDEIDADVGPRLGPVIGRRLALLAAGRQVLVITHLPQVAAFASHHLCVRKAEAGGRTTVTVEVLSGDARVLEIAEMIRGPGQAEAALGQAREMLAEGANSSP